MTVIGDKWGDDVYGVDLENVIIDGIFLNSDEPYASVIDMPYMQEGNTVKKLYVKNAFLEKRDPDFKKFPKLLSGYYFKILKTEKYTMST